LLRSQHSTAGYGPRPAILPGSQRDETIAAAVRQADETSADAIILFTHSGRSAALTAALRPHRACVFAFTPDTRLARRLILHGAIEPQVLSFTNQSNNTVRAAERLLLERKLLSPGARIVVVTESQDEDKSVSSSEARALEKA
jgi:pyruvate kinase